MTDTPDIYMIDAAGRLLRKGEHIGDLEGETLKLLPDFKNYTASVTRWAREQSDKQEAVAAPPPAAAAAPMTDAQIQASRMELLRSEVEKGKVIANKQWKDDCDFAARTGCPPPPKKNPQFGDKSPAFVDWLHQYRHDEFMKRFGVTRRGKVAIVVTDRDTGLDEVTGYRETYFARAKTHLTEVDSIDSSLGEDMDWNA